MTAEPDDVVVEPPEHMWRLDWAAFGGPVEARYRCELCGDVLDVPAGGAHPAEA